MRLGVRVDSQGQHHLIVAMENRRFVDLKACLSMGGVSVLENHHAKSGWGPLLHFFDEDFRDDFESVLHELNSKEFDHENSALASPILSPSAFRDFYAFEQHVKTARARRGLVVNPAWYREPVFYFSNPNSLLGHNVGICAPKGSNELDFELELGVVIGKRGRNIPESQAWDHVAGFTIINDFSARDLQRREMSVGLGPAKGKDFATGVGPWIVMRDEMDDLIDAEGKVHLEMCARVNGKEYSRGLAQKMHFSWPTIIARASADADLFPGDLIGSGTVGTGCILELGPEKVGGWLKVGDVVELEIERIGVLRNQIVARDDSIS